MGDHVATIPSQVAHPWRAAFRTVLQAAIVLFTFVLAAGPPILNILAHHMDGHLPPEVLVWMLGAAAFLSALAGAVARIMALPHVNQALGRIRLDAGSQEPARTASQVPEVNSPATVTRTTNK